MAEYDGLNDDQKKSLKSYRDSLAQSIDFCRPYFEKFTRFYKLFAGVRPPEIDGTYSQVMLWYPYSIIDQELPVTLRSMFSGPDWLTLEAMEMDLERHAKVAQKWVRYQLEKIQRIQQTILPTAQSTHIFGTGYRFYRHQYKKNQKTTRREISGMMGMIEGFQNETSITEKGVITGDYVNIFNVYPAPYGGLVNAPYDMAECVAPYVIVMTWPSKSQIEAEVNKGNFNKEQVAKMFENKTMGNDPSSQYKDELAGLESGWSSFSAPTWIRAAKSKNLDVEKRYRVAWMMGNDNWKAVGEDCYLLYDGEPLEEMRPLVKSVASYDLDNWYGMGLVEPCEDLVISMILNFNHRMDYLAGIFHPPKYVPQRLIDDNGGDDSIFDPEPYKLIAYNHKQFPGGIGNYIWNDRNDDIDQQAFVEEEKMQSYLQEIIGQHPIASLQGTNATTTSALVSKDVARSMLRAINVENSCLHDCIFQTLKLGAKYLPGNDWIRISDADGFPWQEVDKDAITDGYGIMVTGAKDLQLAEITFRRMLAIAPLLLANPQVRGQTEALRQLASKGGYENVDTIMLGSQSPAPAMSQEQQGQRESVPMQGGASTIQNDMVGADNGRMMGGGLANPGNILV